jgi:hypothetical protein
MVPEKVRIGNSRAEVGRLNLQLEKLSETWRQRGSGMLLDTGVFRELQFILPDTGAWRVVLYCWIVESIGLVSTVLLDTGVYRVGMYWTAGYWSLGGWYVLLDTGAWRVGMYCWILESRGLVCSAGY